MPSEVKESLAAAYERYANNLLRSGDLGHGIQEEMLVSSAEWFHRRLIPEGGAFADFFRACLDHHLCLLCAADVNPDDPAECADFHDFLSVVISWIVAFPLELLKKSPEPLLLVVGSLGVGHNLGIQSMRRGGAAVIYWRLFRSLRFSMDALTYRALARQIRQTLVHELIGHQLAFCGVGGPILGRQDLREILDVTGIQFLKLKDSASIAVDDFLNAPDLLKAIGNIEYCTSDRNASKYYSHITELIAFAVEGTAVAPHPYDKILSILKRNFLRLDTPLPLSGRSGASLFEGFDLSGLEPNRYFIEKIDDLLVETPAVFRKRSWVTLVDTWVAWDSTARTAGQELVNQLQPDQELLLDVKTMDYYLELDGKPFLASMFGFYEGQGLAARQRCSDEFQSGQLAVETIRPSSSAVAGFRIQNFATNDVPFRLVPLISPSAGQTA